MNIFLFDSELNWRYANLKLIVDCSYYFCVNFISFCACFVFLFVLICLFFVSRIMIVLCSFFSLSFFLVKYLILLKFCFIMYWPTDNSDILRLYNWICHYSVVISFCVYDDCLWSSSVPHLSYISILLLENLTLSCFIMISTIYGLNCYHTSPEKSAHPLYHGLICRNSLYSRASVAQSLIFRVLFCIYVFLIWLSFLEHVFW